MPLKNLFRRLRPLLVIASLLLATNAAHAACTASPAMPYLQVMNNMAVATSLAIGDTIPGTIRSFQFSGKCDTVAPNVVPGAQIISCYYGSGTEVLSGVYSTGIAGIGIRLRNAQGQPMVHASGYSCDTRAANLGTLNTDMTYSISVSVEFVKTAASLGSGSLDPAQMRFGFGVYQGGSNGALGGSNNYIGFSGSATPRQLTCNVNYPANVNLPAVSLASLASTGATAGTTPFSIGLQCDGAAAVGITFDGAAGTPEQSAASGVLGSMNQGSAGVASNVGIQLVNGATLAPIALGVRNDLGSIVANQASSYRYQVRYYSLSATPGAGTVTGAAVFTFDYQ